MSEKVITPNFGAGKSGGGDPPKPPTYDELMFMYEQQKELVGHLKMLLVSREEEHAKVKQVLDLARRQIEEMSNLNAQAANNLVVLMNALPK